MEKKNQILQELGELSPAVANLSRENTYSVPHGYFDSFPGIVLSLVQGEEAAFGARTSPFHVPNGYFDNLAGAIMAKISQPQSVTEELVEISPLVASISKKDVYTVPGGYFESLELTIPLKLDKPSARVFSFSNTRKIFQYAVAASVAGILVIAAYLYTGSDGSDNMLISYDSAMSMDVSEELSGVQEANIHTYLDEAPTVGYAMNNSDELDLDLYLNMVSDDEIHQYLNDAGPGNQQSKVTGS